MTSNTNQLLTWLKEFQDVWLPLNLPNENHIVELIKTKHLELERLIIENNQDEEEYHRAKLLNNDSSSESDLEELAVASTSTHEVVPDTSLPTPLDIHVELADVDDEEEQSKQILLELSDGGEHEKLSSSDEEIILLRPSIRLQRISKADAELYMPPAWTNLPTNSNSSTAIAQSKIENSSTDSDASKHEAAVSDSDEISISLKTSTDSETSTTSSTSDEDYCIKTRTRQRSLDRKNKSRNQSRRTSTRAYKKHDIVINYNRSSVSNQASIDEASLQESTINNVTAVNDIITMDDDPISMDVMANNDNESVLGSLDIVPDNPMETNLSQDTEQIPSNEACSVTSEDSSRDRIPAEVPSYAHLLNRSKLSSDSDSENLTKDSKKKRSINPSNQLNNNKRAITLSSSSSSSDASTIKRKSKSPTKRRATLESLSSSTDDTETESKSKSSKNGSTVSSSRIRIQRSSSSENSTKSNEKTPRKHRRKRHKKSTSSEASSNNSKQIKGKTTKTRRARSSKSTGSSDNSHSDDISRKAKSKTAHLKLTDNESSGTTDEAEEGEISSSQRKKGRKNIRKIIDDEELQVQTQNAIEAERERRKRIAEKQQVYNESLLEQSYISNHENDQVNNSGNRLILELDKETNEPIVEVSPKLVEQLKPHQCDGVQFLWNNVFESIDVIKNKKNSGNGCILAHCMGLGKTLQVITFLHTAFNYNNITNVKTCLILCPINAALNWSNEFDHWLKDIEPPIDQYQLTTVKPNLRVAHLKYWYEKGGVAIMGYELYRRLATGGGIKNKNLKADAYRCLVDPGPDIVVADEGHILKNAQTALAKCLSKIKTSRRIVLTGTPLQNNLIEYYCMVTFIKPNLLGSQSEYINRFVNPIQNGQHRDSNEEDVRLMKRRACVLHELLTGFVDRKDYSLLKEYLPPKFEYIINIRLSNLQSKLYELYLTKQVDREQRLSTLKKDFKSAKLFADYQYLQKIWTHPFLLYPHFIDHWKKRFYKDEDVLIDDNDLETMFIDDDESLEMSTKKKQKASKQPATTEKFESSYSGFLIDNIKNDIGDTKSMPLSNVKRSSSPSSTTTTTTTLDSDSIENNYNTNGESKSETSDDDITIIRTYPTRSRATTDDRTKNAPSKTADSDIYDNDNNSMPIIETVIEDDSQQHNADDPWMNEMREQFWFPLLDALPKNSKFDIEISGKLLLFKFIIDKCTEIGDKILLFSRSLYALNHIESFLNYLHIENEKEYQRKCEARRKLRESASQDGDDINITDEYIPSPVQWVRDKDYFRMDGQTEIISRKRYAKNFNDESNLRARVFLISTLAGGIGINLTGSNRVIVFDASWNPSHDTQAIFRSYRFGQKKPVYIYRFLAHGTMEEKIYQRQVVKQSISQRVVDDHQLDRHFTQNDIKELYKFKSEPLPEARPRSTLLSDSDTHFNYPIPVDHLLLDLLLEHGRWVHSYHSHDSLLENKIDESLSAEERRRALEEYENLKRLPDPRQIAMQRLQEQARLNMLIAQQNQTAYANSADYQRHLQQNFPLIYAHLQNPIGQTPGMDRTVQEILETLAGRAPVNNTTQSLQRHPLKPKPNQNATGGYVPIQPRSTAATAKAADANQIITLGSDDETGNDFTNTTPK